MRAVLIPALDPPRVIDTPADLDSLQTAVGGMIEFVPVRDAHLYCNEEGKLEGRPYNPLATALAALGGLSADDVIVGDVIVLGSDGPEEAEVPEWVLTTLDFEVDS